MKIRPEKPSEFPRIYDLVRVAFQTAEVTNGKEHDYVEQLRSSGNYIPQLALVADKDNKLVGHIMLTKTQITTSNSKVSALIIAPLCVAREERRQGIGSRLVEESCRLAVNLGYRIVFVVGNPAYYGRFGFKASAAFGIKHVPPIPDENVMVKALSSGALTGVSGTITFT